MQLDAYIFTDKVQRVDAEGIQHRNLVEGSAILSDIDACHKMYLNRYSYYCDCHKYILVVSRL